MTTRDAELRPLTLDDLETTRRWRNDHRVAHGTIGRPFPITALDERAWFEQLGASATPSAAVWAVEAGGQIVGVVQLTEIDWIHRTCWFGVFVGPEHQGHGYGRAATRLASMHAFERFNLRQVRLRVRSDNSRAVKLYESIGFELEGRLQGLVLEGGRPTDVVLMRLTPEAIADNRASQDHQNFGNTDDQEVPG